MTPAAEHFKLAEYQTVPTRGNRCEGCAFQLSKYCPVAPPPGVEKNDGCVDGSFAPGFLLWVKKPAG